MPTETDVFAVIDDDPMIRHALQKLLLALGYTVELYDSSEAFLQRAAACRAMCLLIDVQLGSSSGIELARQLAKAGLKFPIMFMTANDDKAVQRQAIEVGCVGYLLKPFAAKTANEHLGRAENRRAQTRLVCWRERADRLEAARHALPLAAVATGLTIRRLSAEN